MLGPQPPVPPGQARDDVAARRPAGPRSRPAPAAAASARSRGRAATRRRERRSRRSCAPSPANRRSAAAGLMLAVRNGVAIVRIAGSAGYIPGWADARATLAQGCSACAGVPRRDQAHSAAPGEQPAALGPRVRLERAGQGRRPAADHHRDLAGEIHPGEIVMARLGQVHAVADEDQRRVDALGRRRARDPQDQVVGQAKRRRARRSRPGPPRVPPAGSAVPRTAHSGNRCPHRPPARGPRAAKRRGDEIGGAAMALAAGVAAFHVVGGERLDRRSTRPPPARRSARARARWRWRKRRGAAASKERIAHSAAS